MTATTAKKTTSRAVKGRASSKAFPNSFSSMIPVKEVKSIIIIKPINPTAAMLNASENMRINPTIN